MKIIKREKAYETVPLHPFFECGTDLIWDRDKAGQLLTNVRLYAIQHSPSGFEIGYPGSGPADLALNAMAVIFPIGPFHRCFRGEVSELAFSFHQDFKFRFLAQADKNKGKIQWESIQSWLQERVIESCAKGSARFLMI